MSNELSNRFQKTLEKRNRGRPPVWFMRQAGRYHSHYQALRQKHSFIELCKIPTLACETTLGPIRDFDFDAAILFSDLLFPLEALGVDLTYQPGPSFTWRLRTLEDFKSLHPSPSVEKTLGFQKEALSLIRRQLDPEKALLGFVGGPFTLYYYAIEGKHEGSLLNPLLGFEDGRWKEFQKWIQDLLIENLCLQIEGGADAIVIMDTCAGKLSASVFKKEVVPGLQKIVQAIDQRFPKFPLLYYSKETYPPHWEALEVLKPACVGLGVDWNQPLPEVLKAWGGQFVIQGNFNPHLLLGETAQVEKAIRAFFEGVACLEPSLLQGWICGLGHGILPSTPEAHVRLFLALQKSYFHDRDL